MRDRTAGFVGLVLLAGVFTGIGAPSAQAGAVESLRRDVETLSSPAFEGRGVGTKGIEKAREYVESRFREVGLVPLGTEGYAQPFPGPKGTTLVNLIGVLGKPDGSRYVIVGAHYDHLGFGQPGEADYGKMFPGADDNASGIATLLECARRLGEEDEKPLHPVVFIAFSGEEEGLLGSKYYVEHPRLPLSDCIAMVNLDTVGRLFGKHLFVFGTGTAEELKDIVRGVNAAFQFELDLPERDPGASDQVSFSRRGVPAVQIFSGAHADYHRPTDTPDKLDYEGMDRIADFTTELVWYLADRDKPLTFVPPGAAEAARQAAGTGRQRRVSFGSIPDFSYSGQGVMVSGVIPGSPAEKAGLAEGDRIVKFAGVAVDDLRAFSDILKGLSPGEEVTVVFVRDGERHEAKTVVVERK